MSSSSKKTRTLPSREALVSYLNSLDHVPSKQEICRHFRVKGGPNKIALKALLKELASEKIYKKNPKKIENNKERIPRGSDSEGEALGSIHVGRILKTSRGFEFAPTFKKTKTIFKIVSEVPLLEHYVGKVYKGKLVKQNPPSIELVEEIGAIESISKISAHMFGLPMEFPKGVLQECHNLKVPEVTDREDVRSIPLVTIDGVDSRDFDDAVWAEPDQSPENPGGFHLIVAIADVAHYVRPGSEVDREAWNRGTSTYFPDSVIPMLPEALSNDLCSLRPQEDRACVGVHLWISKEGHKLRHKFFRGLMKSAARLTYEQVQNMYERKETSSLPSVDHLYGAYKALDKARQERGTLEVDSIEPYVVLDKTGAIQDFVIKERLDSHRLIEEFMVLANVAAAEFLEEHEVPTLYRVHDKPDFEKVEELKRTLNSMKIKYSGPLKNPGDFTKLLSFLKDSPYKNIINELVLRCQSQAVYSVKNTGHFGLNLKHYCHFTSPIRRYPDLLVHRGILSILGYKKDGLSESNISEMAFLGVDTSSKERRSESAERDAMDRYMTHYLAPRVGEYFKVYISGISKAGLFVSIPSLGASGLVPMNRLGDDYYIYREHPTRLEGRRWRHVFSFGDMLKVKLLDADLVKGRLTFELEEKTENSRSRGSYPMRRKKSRR